MAQFVAEEIQQRMHDEQLTWESFAVLYRMNAQSRLFEENLRRLQIPYRLVGGKSFFDRREIRDLIAYAGCLSNSDDDVRLLRIINTPARGISASTIERMLEVSVKRKCRIYETMQSSEFLDDLTPRAAESVRNFLELLQRYSAETVKGNLAPTIFKLVDEIEYVAELRRSCRSQEEALNREANVREFVETLREHDRPGGSLQNFLDDMALDQNREEKDAGRGVTLITLHAAKGLEFPHVYLIGIEEGLLPHDRSKAEGALDEERRLLYVGITRAMRTVTFTRCCSRMKYGLSNPCAPSSFLKEFDSELIEEVQHSELSSAPVQESVVRSRFAQMRAAVEGA